MQLAALETSPLPTTYSHDAADDRGAADPRDDPGPGGTPSVGWCSGGDAPAAGVRSGRRVGSGAARRGGLRRRAVGARGGRRGRRGRLVRELVVQVLDPALDVLAVSRVRDAPQILLERSDGLGLVALALVGRRDDWQDGVNAAVDRIRVIEVANGLVVVRFVEELLATQIDGVGAVHVALADLRRVAGGRVARGAAPGPEPPPRCRGMRR